MSTRESVLDALVAAGGDGVSGQSLADRFGVSRVAISKHVAALQAQGYTIEAVTGRGYRLVATPSVSTPAGVQPLVRSPFWLRFEGGMETGSTNDDARALARSGAPEGTIVVVARQTAGRGRLGRSWLSPEGGAYLSAVLRPQVAPADVSTLTLALGVAVAKSFERFGARPRLKWPNDVLLETGKVAGILVEMAAEADRVEWLVAGIGANVLRPSAPAGVGPAYLSDAVGALAPAEVAAAVLDEVADAYAQWVATGFRAFAADYAERDALLGESVAVRDAAGSVKASGVATGVDIGGRLLVRAQDGTVTAVAAGEVTLRDSRDRN